MNWFFVIGGLLSIVAVPIHIWGGEYMINRTATEAFPDIPNGDSSIAKQEIRFGWHMGSVDMLVSGSVLLLLGLTNYVEPAAVIARLIGIYFLGYSVVIAVLPATALRRVDTLLASPQWLFALLVALLAWWGSW